MSNFVPHFDYVFILCLCFWFGNHAGGVECFRLPEKKKRRSIMYKFYFGGNDKYLEIPEASGI